MALMPSVDIDALTGRPIDPQAEHRGRQQVRKDQRARLAVEAHRLRNALASPEGHVLRDTITNALADRLEGLMRADPPCQVLLTLVGQWTQTLAVGAQLAQALTADLDGR